MNKLLLLLTTLLFCICSHAQNVNNGCGIWRRDVKILTDLSSEELTELLHTKPVAATVKELTSMDQPEPLTNNAKWENVPRMASEKKQERIRVKIVACGKEADDHDYHIVIADPDDLTQTMVCEIPDPDCLDVANNEVLSERYRALRSWFDDNIIKPTSKIMALEEPVLVDVIGVPFWDGRHPGNVHGAAPNYRELHPVLNFVKDGVYAVKIEKNEKK